jgi:hypothetical protein
VSLLVLYPVTSERREQRAICLAFSWERTVEISPILARSLERCCCTRTDELGGAIQSDEMGGGRVRHRAARGSRTGRTEHLVDPCAGEFRSALLCAMDSFLAECDAVEDPGIRSRGLLNEMHATREVCRAEPMDARVYQRIGACLASMGNENFISRHSLQASATRLAHLLPSSWFIAQPGEALRFFARVAATCENPYKSVAEASTLRIALRAVHGLLADRHLADTALVVDAVQMSAASLAEAIRCALFAGTELELTARSSVENSDSASSRREVNSESASDAGPSGTDGESSNTVSEYRAPDKTGLGYSRRTRNGRGWSAQSSLRLNALDALCSLANASSVALIPYWALFLPERDGVVGYHSCFARKTLSNVILHDPSDDIRAAAVGSAIALLSGSLHFTRSHVSALLPYSSSTASSFTSTSARVLRACFVMYGVVATAIQHEASAAVLARLMKLATVLCHNAGVPAVPPQRPTLLYTALRLRLLGPSNIDRTSRIAGLSCLAEVLPMLSGVLDSTDTENLVTSLVLILGEESSPVAEVLSAIQSTFECKPSLVRDHWTFVEKELARLSAQFADDQVVRLHVLRSVKCVLDTTAREPWNVPQCLEAMAVTWSQYIRSSFEAPFHAVRSCGLQCAESLFKALSAIDPYELENELPNHNFLFPCVNAIGRLLEKDGSDAVRCAAVKALSETPAVPPGCELRRSAYAYLVSCLTTDPKMNVRSRAMLASASLIDNGTGWLKSDSNGRAGLLLEQLQSHLNFALAILSSSCNIDDLKSMDVVDAKRTDFASKSSYATQSEWEAVRTSSLRALGSFAMGFEGGTSSTLNGISSTHEHRKIIQLVCRVTSRANESPKLRWNGCHVLGRFMSGRPDVELFGDLVTEASDVLCFALREGSNYKVKIAASKALRKALLSASKPGCYEPCSILTAAASVLSEDSEHGEAGRSRALLRNDLVAECNGLLAETLQMLDVTTCRVLGESVGISLQVLFNGLVSHAGLPRYALLALEEQNFGDPPEGEEYQTALDAWNSLSPEMCCSFRKAGGIARYSSLSCDAKDLLLRCIPFVSGNGE